jgi:hypothetical protein
MPSIYQAPQTTGSGWGSATSSMGKAVENMPTFGNSFLQGMKLGYQGEQMTVAPFLAYRKAKQEKNILNLQADLMELQAQSFQTAADDVMRAGHQASASVSYQTGQAKSSVRASQGASGVRVGATGSSAETLASFDIVKEIQTNQIMANAVAQSFGYRRKALDVQHRADAIRRAADSISPWASAITTHLGDVIDSLSMVGNNFSSGQGGGLSADTWKNFGSSFSSMFGGGK